MLIQTSDASQKILAPSIPAGLDWIKKLKPVSYRWNTGARNHYGFIAQDIAELIDTNQIEDFGGLIKTESTYGLRINDLIAPLVKAVQELSEQVVDIRRRLDIVTGRIE